VRVPPVRVADGPALSRVGLVQALAPHPYEDAALMVIDKPSGLAVHGGSGLSLA